jgi:hypothetical protein
MKYIIDEEDLKDIFNGEKPRFDVFESVEMIASGKMDICGEYEDEHLRFYDFNRKPKYQRINFRDFDKHNGKNIEIYIKEL